MKQRSKRLLAYMLALLLVGNIIGSDAFTMVAKALNVDKDITVDADSSDDYVFISGGVRLTISEGVTVSGNVDFSKLDSGDSATLTNNGTILGNVIVGDSAAQIYNYGTISGDGIDLIIDSYLYNTGSVPSVTLQNGVLEMAGGSIGTVTDTIGSRIVWSGGTIQNLTSLMNVELNGSLQTNSFRANGVVTTSSATLNVSDYLNLAEAPDGVTVNVNKDTTIDCTNSLTYGLYCNGKEYITMEGESGTLIDWYGKTVSVEEPADSHIVIDGVDEAQKYLYGEISSQITLEAEDGYCFPEGYESSITSNGEGDISVSKESDTKLILTYTMADTDAEDIVITIDAASKKPKPIGEGTIRVSSVYYGREVQVAIESETNDVSTAVVEYKRKGESDTQYVSVKPSVVGEYTARVTFRANENYAACRATTDFKIAYLPIPNQPYTINGIKGENGFYTSRVDIVPVQGYKISTALNGNYQDSLKWYFSKSAVAVYFEKEETGEKTNGTMLPNIKIDLAGPNVSATHGVTYYGENLTVTVNDPNLSTVVCNGANIPVESDTVQMILTSDRGSRKYHVEAKDLAGNTRIIDITLADEWLRTGVIPGNTLVQLSTGRSYRLGSGNWMVSGDSTQYVGNQNIYVRNGGSYTFTSK